MICLTICLTCQRLMLLIKCYSVYLSDIVLNVGIIKNFLKMFCNGSSNVIRQCNNICVYYLAFVRISHIKRTLETNVQTQIFGSCVAGNNLDFYS